MLFTSWPNYSEEEAEAVKQVLLSNCVNYWSGDKCKTFEQAFAEWIGVPHAVALANGTLALEVALHALNLPSGAEVIVPARTFVATAMSVLRMGLKPVFADVDLNTQGLSAQTVLPLINERTRAIVVVHLGGMPAEMDELLALALQHRLKIIEDCAQAHGATYHGKHVGSIGDIAAWSFCQDKIMTTGGEGGMVTTPHHHLWQRAWEYKDHGKSFNAVFHMTHPPGFRWLHHSLGTNARMTEMQAAIGLIQLSQMLEWHRKRNENANRIFETVASFPLVSVPHIPQYVSHAFYKCYLFVKEDYLASGWTRDRIVDEISSAGVPCLHGGCSEVYLEQIFQMHRLAPTERLPNARQLGQTSMMLLVHPTLSPEAIDNTCEVLSQCLSCAQVISPEKRSLLEA